LIFLSHKPGSCQRDVAKEIRCSSPTARWYLIRLEVLGLIRSRRHGAEVQYTLILLCQSYRVFSELIDQAFGTSMQIGWQT
jgi:predicted transcriptional regulator